MMTSQMTRGGILMAFPILLTIILTATQWTWLERHFYEQPRGARPSAPFFNISRSVTIALDAQAGAAVASATEEYLGVRNATAFAAINGTRYLADAERLRGVPLYTRTLLAVGRHDHMQISTPGMLGCLLSHAAVWRTVGQHEVVAVFEEDAVLDPLSTERMRALEHDLAATPFDLLMLESGHINVERSRWKYIGDIAATCARQPCQWLGSRGYVVTHRGAQVLLKHAEPAIVQVDALMGLVSEYEVGFRMYWPVVDIAHQDYTHRSTLWDGCIKCYVPTSPWFFVAVGVLWPLSLVVSWFFGFKLHAKGSAG